MVKDPICGMMVDEKTARFKTTHKNATYYFCSAGCLETFEKDPEKYISKQDIFKTFSARQVYVSKDSINLIHVLE